MWVVKYPHLGPRVRGIKARMLQPDQLKNLVMLGSVDDLLAQLSQTSYRAAVEKLTRETPPGVAQEAILSHVFGELYEASLTMPDAAKEASLTYLMRYEVDNVKSVARLMILGKFSREASEKAISWVFEDLMGRRFIFAELLNASNLEELASRARLLNHPTAEYLSRALELSRDYPAYGEAIVETLLDKSWIEPLLKFDEPIKTVAEYMADFYNVNLVLRGKLWGLPPQLVEDLVVKTRRSGEFLKAYGVEAPRMIEELSQVPVVNAVLTLGISELRDVVRYLHIAYYSTFRRFALGILNEETEFSPASALAMVHLRDLEAQVISSIYNVVWSNAERVVRERMYLILM